MKRLVVVHGSAAAAGHSVARAPEPWPQGAGVGRALRAAIGLAACSALAGCSGAPSEGELRAAVDKQVSAQTKGMEGLLGKGAAGMVPEIKQFKKIGCKEDGEKAYRCDVEIEVSQLGATSKSAQSMRVVKGSDGWALTN